MAITTIIDFMQKKGEKKKNTGNKDNITPCLFEAFWYIFEWNFSRLIINIIEEF